MPCRSPEVSSAASSYADTHQAVAQQLIDFDREFARMFSAPPKTTTATDDVGVDPEESQRYFVQQAASPPGSRPNTSPP